MLAVGLKVLKNKLSEYVRRAAAGETILVTDRERVVAELGPPRAGRRERVEDEAIAEMIREGILTPARERYTPAPDLPGVATLDEILKELDEDRADR